MLNAIGLTLWRGANCLFEDLSFGVTGGAAVLIRGVNGSGKTTLLRVLCGLTRPESGHVEWHNARIDSNRALFGPQVAFLGHASGLKDDLTVAQNLAFYARLLNVAAEPVHALLDSLNLGHCADLEVRYLSAGQRRRAALARLFMSGANLWLLDEPFTNLDTAGRNVVEDRIVAHLASGGLAVIAAHHDLDLRQTETRTITLGVGA